MIRMAVVGCGYWGPNLIRNIVSCPTATLVAVCDRDQSRVERMRAQYPAVDGYVDVDPLLERRDIDAVAITTPVGTHYILGMAALKAGKHVLIEKPLAESARSAEEMIQCAEAAGLTLMVDHTYLYSNAVRKIKEIFDAGDLGDLYFIDSVRINLGLFQREVNVLWDLAPHDLSIVDFLLGRLPRTLAAFGACHADNHNEIEDVAYLNMDFGGSLMASFHVSWLSPVKIRHLIVGGSKKSIVYNDLDPGEKVKVYDRGITVSETAEARRRVMVAYRTGDVWSPNIRNDEPLQEVVRHFTECIREHKRPLTDGAAGLRIVRILEAAQRSIKAQGGRITL